MADMTASEARTHLKPFQDGLATIMQILEIWEKAEAVEGQIAARAQEADRLVAQAAARGLQAEAEADERVRRAQQRAEATERSVQAKMDEARRTLERQLATLTDELVAERRRMEQAVQDRQQAEKDRDLAKQEAKALETIRRDAQKAAADLARLETTIAELTQRLEAKRAAYEELAGRIAALKA